MKMRSCYLGELTWPDVKEFLAVHDVAVVPVGSCEQHGPHLPMDTDAYDAFWLSLEAAEKAQCALVAPPIMVFLCITWIPEQLRLLHTL